MKKEDKELLFKDLCSRLPYGVKINAIYSKEHASFYRRRACKNGVNELTINIMWLYHVQNEIDIKPYLFPLSSMTEEQKEELEDMNWSFDDSVINNIVEYLGKHRQFVAHFDCFALIDWLNKNYFDYRDLIGRGLAIDCTDLNIY